MAAMEELRILLAAAAPRGRGAEDARPTPRPDAAQLAELLALSSKGKRKQEQRSFDLVQHARCSKSIKTKDQEIIELRQELRQRDQTFSTICRNFACVASFFGLRIKQRPMDEARAKNLIQLACSSRIRGRAMGPQQKAQNAAANAIASTLLNKQEQFKAALLNKPLACELAAPLHVLVYCHQWDETSQKLKGIYRTLQGERISKQRSSVQIMVQIAYVWQCLDARTHPDAIAKQPWLCPALRLERQTADSLLQAYDAVGMFKLNNDPVLESLARNGTFVILSFTLDRANANTKAFKWMAQFAAEHIPRGIAFHLEPCWAHGVALAKTRTHHLKEVCGAVAGFSRLMRVSANIDAFRASITHAIRHRVKRVYEPFPESSRKHNKELLESLVGEFDAEEMFYKTSRIGQRTKTSFLLDLEKLLEVIDFADTDTHSIKHYCCVCEGSPLLAQGKSIGEPCCKTIEDTVQRIATPVLNWLTGRTWVDACTSRWANLSKGLIRMVVGIAANDIFRSAIEHWLLCWKMDDKGLEAKLSAQLALNNDNFSIKNKCSC